MPGDAEDDDEDDEDEDGGGGASQPVPANNATGQPPARH